MQQQQDLQSGHLLKPNYKWFFVLQMPPIPRVLLVPCMWHTFVSTHTNIIHQLPSLDNLHCEFQW